jgi:hypothetical protein
MPKSWYAIVHQTGATIMPKKDNGYLRFKVGDRFVSAKSVIIPKRLHIYENFNLLGKKMVKESI